MKLVVLYGKAGCGKTTKMVELIKTCKHYVVLAPTNSAVENIYKLSGIEKRKKFKTIYSYFRIDYENNMVLGAVNMKETIFIDEFGMIDKKLFKKCYIDAKEKGCKTMIISGDVMQLNPIYAEKQYISFNKLKKWHDVWNKLILSRVNNDSKISKLPKLNTTTQAQTAFNTPYLHPSVVEHLHLNIFGSKLIMNNRECELVPLTINHRSSGKVKDVLNNIYSGNMNWNYEFVEFYQLCELIMNNEYTFIASKYKLLQNIYDLIYDNYLVKKLPFNDIYIFKQQMKGNLGFKVLYLYSGLKLVICKTVKDKYINGQEVIFTGSMLGSDLKCIDILTNQEIIVKKTSDEFGNLYYPVSPLYLLTVHKSQGRTIKNVIVCIDEIFDMCMLYTAITRAKENLKFYTICNMKERVAKLMESASINEFKQLNTIAVRMKEVIN